ncbi:hypothetical protein EK599_04955 [Vibrio sp. T187]|uniref:hypothetical protein n=1 Tax=Vibrio TaxID=662 RepID=UPI0010C965E8|nr:MULTISPECIES: hypothetical protein [Vibrio]MBW3695028.1 hypothetical protein [Vibrio sp. T187]
MNRTNLCSLIAALLGTIGLIYLVVGGSSFPIDQWPTQAFQDIVFSLVMGFGVSKYIAYAYATMIFVTVFTVSYALGHKFSQWLPAQEQG